jgi:hypothetical protein
MKRCFFGFLALCLLSAASLAQEFEIKKYDVTARLDNDAHEAAARVKLRMVNLSGRDLIDKVLLAAGDKPRLTFYLNTKAKVTEMKLNSQAVQFRTSEDARANLLIVSTDITSSFASAPEFDVEFAYSIPVPDRNPAMHVSTAESFMLPSSFWVPVKHNPFAEHGADTAPYSLTIEPPPGANLKLVSSGVSKSPNSYEQIQAAQPFFFVGDYEVEARGTTEGGAQVEVYAPRGLDAAGKQQAKRVADEAAKIVEFFTAYFGAAQSGVFRVVTVKERGVALAAPGVVTVDDALFRRDTLDQGTIELMANAASRSWIDGRVLVRGRGTWMLRDGLPVYMAAQYLGARFGDAQRDEAFERYRRAYEPIARGQDAALLMQNPLDRNYVTSVFNKGALVWRIVEKKLGADTFKQLVRRTLDRQRTDVLTLSDWRNPLCGAARCASFKNELLNATAQPEREAMQSVFAQWVETVVLPDFAVGQPQPAAGGLESAVVNFGDGEFTVDVIATTESGEKISRTVALKAGEYGAVTFPAGTKLARLEVDPEKVYVQKDYTNDTFPRRPPAGALYGQASLAFGKGEFAAAEAKAREALAAEPNTPTLQALLGRALLAQKKNDEAAKAFAEALKSNPVPLQAYGWSHLGLGELALQRGAHAEAANHFRLAAAAELDPATTEAAREGALKAERAANAVKLPDDVKAFLQQFDAAMLQGPNAVAPLVEQGNLRDFVRRLIVTKPAAWATEPLRAEAWDADRTAVDVNLRVKVEGKDYTGRAVYVLSRAGGKLKLSDVPSFDVK